MSNPTRPTDEGMLRYLETRGYYQGVLPPVECVCERECQARCAGECGCVACSIAFSEFCDDMGLDGPHPWTDEQKEEALFKYRVVYVPW